VKHNRSVLIIILYATLLSGCEKIPFDFRNKYLGDWMFEVSNRHELYNPTRGFYDTTTVKVYHGEIQRGSSHEEIVFTSNLGYSEEFLIDKNGQIIPVNDHGLNYSEGGGFQGRDIFTYSYYHHWGATRQFIDISICGKRE
jgi:hypothetical protein